MRKRLLVGVIFLCMVGLVLGGTRHQTGSKPWKAEDKGVLVQMVEQAMSSEDSGKLLNKSTVKFLNRVENKLDMSRFDGDATKTRFFKKADKTNYIQAMIVTNQEWDGAAWVNLGRITFRYNPDGNNLELKIEDWDAGSSSFKNFARLVGTFDGNGLLVMMLMQIGDAAGTGWVDFIRDLYTYDANHFLTQMLEEVNTGWSWDPVYKEVFTNNPSGDPILEVDYTWDGVSWVNDYQYMMTWTGINLTQEIGQDWNGSAWENVYKDDYTYDGFGNQNTDIYQTWNGSSWDNYSRWEGAFYAFNVTFFETIQYWNGFSWDYENQWTYIYNPVWDMTEELYQTWNGTAWENYLHWLYTYDGSGNQTVELAQEWIGSIWYNDEKLTSTYDTNNDPVTDVYQSWDGAAWVNEYRDLYTFEQSSGVADKEGILPSTFALSNYPNPFNPSTTIRFDLPQGSEVTMAVYDLTGRLVDRVLEGVRYEAGVHAIAWSGMDENGKQAPSGVYLVKMEAGNTVKVLRCTLVK